MLATIAQPDSDTAIEADNDRRFFNHDVSKVQRGNAAGEIVRYGIRVDR
jgi:hypothetical protein